MLTITELEEIKQRLEEIEQWVASKNESYAEYSRTRAAWMARYRVDVSALLAELERLYDVIASMKFPEWRNTPLLPPETLARVIVERPDAPGKPP